MDYEILAFSNQATFRAWLTEHGSNTEGVWLKIYKKGSNVPTISYAEALDEALCFGWIDGQVKKFDEQAYLQKFTPRRKKSMWSKQNIEHVARLTEAGLMMSAGVAEVERAQADGRWQAAYDKPSEMTAPQDFLAALQKHPKAYEFYKTLNKTNTFAIAWRLQTAKTEETRLRRQEKIIALLEAGQKLQ